jgi:hypothetical protein
MGGVAVPCHPGRPNVGLCEHYTTKPPLENVIAVEVLNGGSRKGEDDRSEELVAIRLSRHRRLRQPSGQSDWAVRDPLRRRYRISTTWCAN